jgi:streptogramin lyase
MRKTRLIAAALAAAALLVPATAGAATNSTVQGTVVGSALSLALTAPAVMTLTPGASPSAPVNATTTPVAVTATGGWYLFAKDGGTGADGKMDLTSTPGCDSTTSAASLATALQVYATGTLTLGSLTTQGTAVSPLSFSSAYQELAHGTLSQAVTANLVQPVAANETLKGGCSYSLTTTFGVSPDSNTANIQ